jgi:CRP-like cAMP-binding protein
MSRSGKHGLWREAVRRILEELARRVGLPVSIVVALADEVTPAHFGADDIIFSPSNTHTFSYILVGGRVMLQCRDHRNRAFAIQLVRQGRLFGVSWRPQLAPRLIRAVAQTDVTAAVVDQGTIARLFERLDERARMNLFSYATRALSGLVAQKAAMRGLAGADRLRYALYGLVPDFGRNSDERSFLDLALSSADLAAMLGLGENRIRHLLATLREAGLVEKLDGYFSMVAAPNGAVFERPTRYLGAPAEWARPTLGQLLGHCAYSMNERSADFIRRTAKLYEVPDGELLLPPDSADVVAFVVLGSAWLEAAGLLGTTAVVQLVPQGRFVRLPTRPSSRGIRLRGRAHRSCVVGLLTSSQMSDAMSLMSLEGQLTIHDVTTRGLSRFLCDLTTAPTRTTECRLLAALGFLAQDFPKRAPAIDVSLSRDDLAHHVGAHPATISTARARLAADGWISWADEQYVLLKPPPGQAHVTACQYCTPRRREAASIGYRPTSSAAPRSQ